MAIFGASPGFSKMHLVLMKLEYYNIWQVILVSEYLKEDTSPELVFLLDSVEQITYGEDYKMRAASQENRPGIFRAFTRIGSAEPAAISQMMINGEATNKPV